MNKSPASKNVYPNLNSFNFSSQPLSNIEELYDNQDWEIKSLEISANGKTGVLYIETSLGSFVLKCNNDAPIDYFFNVLAGMMHVNVVETHVLACYEDLFKRLVYRIEKFCEPDEILSSRLKSRLDFPFYQLMLYVPSVTLNEVGRNRFIAHQLAEHKLQSIGICIGFDLLTNNSDRFKLSSIWSANSEGNISNVLVNVPEHFKFKQNAVRDRENTSVKLGDFVFIDHSGFLLDIENNKIARENFNKYAEKVTNFHDNMIQYLRKQFLEIPSEFKSMIEQIELFTKYRLEGKEITSIIEGIIFSTNVFVQLHEEKVIEKILKEFEKSDKQDQEDSNKKRKNQKQQYMEYWDQYWDQDLKKIKLKYLDQFYVKISAVYATYGEIVNEICQRVSENVEKFGYGSSVLQSLQKISERNSKRSKTSRMSEHSSQQQSDFKSQLEEKVASRSRIQVPLSESEKVKVIPQGVGRRKLKQKLEAFQKKNYEDPADNR